MGELYHSFHQDYELMVEETTNHQFWVKIVRDHDGGRSYILHAFQTLEDALDSAKRFPGLLNIAGLEGYVLQQDFFVHSSGISVHVSFAMDMNLDAARFRDILRKQKS